MKVWVPPQWSSITAECVKQGALVKTNHQNFDIQLDHYVESVRVECVLTLILNGLFLLISFK